MTNTLKSSSAILLAMTFIAIAPPAIAQHLTGDEGMPTNKAVLEQNLELELENSVAQAILSMVESGFIEDEFSDLDPGVPTVVRAAYAQRVFAPVWTRVGAAQLFEAKRDLASHGLLYDDVAERDLEALVAARFDISSAENRADADVKLTAAWLRMVSAVSGGLSGDRPRRSAIGRQQNTLISCRRPSGDGQRRNPRKARYICPHASAICGSQNRA